MPTYRVYLKFITSDQSAMPVKDAEHDLEEKKWKAFETGYLTAMKDVKEFAESYLNEAGGRV